MRGRAFATCPALLLWFIGSAEAGAPESGVYRAANDRALLSFAFHAPTGRAGTVDLSEVHRWVSSGIEAHTDLRIDFVDDAIIDRCSRSSRRLTCLIEESSGSHPRYLLILTAAAIVGGDRLAALLIDVDDALVRIQKNSPEAEDEIAQFSIVARPPVLERATEAEGVRSYIDRLIGEHLEDAFAAGGHWEPFGAIEIEVDRSDQFGIELDGIGLGATIEGRAELIDVRPGEHTIRLEHEAYEAFEATVTVQRGETARVRATPIDKPNATILALRRTVLWSGVVSAAVGIGIMVYGAVALDRHDRTELCVGPNALECPTQSQRFGGESDVSTESSNGSGPPIIPLGYSLVGLGTAWMLGPLLDDDEARIPWIEVIVGLAVFGASFGLSVALDRDDPVCTNNDGC